MAQQILPPVPPLTANGFADPVWLRWLSRLHQLVNTSALADSYSYELPANGFTIYASGNAATILLDPDAALSAGAMFLPPDPFPGFHFRVVSTKAIAAFSLIPSLGQFIIAPPSSLAANVPVAYLFNAVNLTWYKVQ